MFIVAIGKHIPQPTFYNGPDDDTMAGTGTETDPYIITTVAQLQSMGDDLTAYYELGCDIDAYETVNWNGGAGFLPIGDADGKFTGQLDGKQFRISYLFIDRAVLNSGLFGVIGAAGVVSNVGVIDCEISGGTATGALAGQNEGTISGCFATGNISGGYIGGITGVNEGGAVTNSLAKVILTGTSDIGGLIGIVNGGTITNCYAAGAISGTGEQGGFVSLVDTGTFSGCYWDITINSGLDDTKDGAETGIDGLATAAMKQQASFSGWDFTTVWNIDEAETYPYLNYPAALESTSNIAKALSNLRDLIAECRTFQTAIGASGTTAEKIAAAKERIHLSALSADEETGFTRPFALICHAGSDKAETIGTSQTTGYGGDLELRFEQEAPVQYRPAGQEANAEKYFKNFYEKTMQDAMELSGQAGYFAINNWDIIDGPGLLGDNSSEENIFGVRILINWGII